MNDEMNELIPHVDSDGITKGFITRAYAHGGERPLHPVVHLHVFNSKHELYLQKRPEWKDIQPGKWDTATGGHVSYGESIGDALRREVAEELGIKDFEPRFLAKYVFESDRERELVYVHTCVYDGDVIPNKEELDGGRFWTISEIKESEGKGIMTPNFEYEFERFLLNEPCNS